MANLDGYGYYYTVPTNETTGYRLANLSAKYTGIKALPYANILPADGTTLNKYVNSAWPASNVSQAATTYTENDVDGSVLLTWGYNVPRLQGVLLEIKANGGTLINKFLLRATSTSRKLCKGHQGYDSNGLSYGEISLSGVYSWGTITTNVVAFFERDKLNFTVSFKRGANGTGTEQSKTVVEDAGTATLGAIFTRLGYTQDGWSTTDGGAKVYGLNAQIASVASNLTLYPHWVQKPQVTIIFDANGGQAPSENIRKIRDGQTFGTLPTVARSGYTFLGWFTAATGGTRIYSTTVYLESFGTRIFAHWSKNVVVVTFDAQGGEVSPASINAVTGRAYGALPTALRNRDESFVGWFTAATGGTEITATSVVGSAAITLYAHYAPKQLTYTVYFHDTTGANATASRVFRCGVDENLPKMGADLGWTLPVGYEVSASNLWIDYANGATYASAITVRDLAQAEGEAHLWLITNRKTYTVTLNANGGTCEVSSIAVVAGDQVGELPTAKFTNKIFDGWYTAASGGTKVTAEYMPTGNVTIYAHFVVQVVAPWVTIRFYD